VVGFVQMSPNCTGSLDIFAAVSIVLSSEDIAEIFCSGIGTVESFSSLGTSHTRDCVESLSASTG